MKRLLRDAALVAIVAITVWVVRGSAQDTAPLGPFTISCQGGSILFHSSVSGDAITSELRLMTGVFSTGSPYAMTVTDCYLWSMTPTPTP